MKIFSNRPALQDRPRLFSFAMQREQPPVFVPVRRVASLPWCRKTLSSRNRYCRWNPASEFPWSRTSFSGRPNRSRPGSAQRDRIAPKRSGEPRM